jgi:hypothetical protein
LWEIRKWLGFSTRDTYFPQPFPSASGHGCCAYLLSTTAWIAMACKSVLIGMPPLTTEQCVVCYSTRSVHRLLCLDRPYFLGQILLRSQQTLTKATSQYRADMVCVSCSLALCFRSVRSFMPSFLPRFCFVSFLPHL